MTSFRKIPNRRFYENPSGGNCVVPRGETYRWGREDGETRRCQGWLFTDWFANSL